MKHRLTQTLLGFLKPVKGSPPVLSAGETSTNQHDWAGRLKVKRLKPSTFRRSLRLGFLKTCRDNLQLSTVILLTGIQLLAGMGVVYAAFDVSNTALLEYSDNRGWFPTTVTDTAAIRIVDGPSVKIAKDVFNTRTGETSPDIVDAYRGDMVLFRITIINTGDYYARYVEIADSIPVGTVYEAGTALDTTSFDTANPPDQILFQHQVGGAFDQYDTATVTAIKWLWNFVGGEPQGSNNRMVGFRARVQ